jgi:hypothetical protein
MNAMGEIGGGKNKGEDVEILDVGGPSNEFFR